MLLKPCKSNLLVQFFPPAEGVAGLVMPDGKATPLSSDRIKCKILAVSKLLEPEFPPGAYLLLRPNYNFFVVDPAAYIALIDSSVVEAIVLDDHDEPVIVD